MADDEHIVACGKTLGGAVGRAVVNDEHVAGVSHDFVEHRIDVGGFVVNGQRGRDIAAAGRSWWVPPGVESVPTSIPF